MAEAEAEAAPPPEVAEQEPVEEESYVEWIPTPVLAGDGTAPGRGEARLGVFAVDTVPSGMRATSYEMHLLTPEPPLPVAAPMPRLVQLEAPPPPTAPLAQPGGGFMAMLLGDSAPVAAPAAPVDDGRRRAPTPPPEAPSAPLVRRHVVTNGVLASHLSAWRAQPLRRAAVAAAGASAPAPALSALEVEQLAGAAAGPYATLRAFSRTLRLSPFSLDALVAALLAPTPTAVADEAHTAVLRVLFAHKDAVEAAASPFAAAGAPPPAAAAAGDAAGGWDALLDTLTWPEYARAYIRFAAAASPDAAAAAPRRIAAALRRREASALPPADKLALLTFLCDQLLDTRVIRTEMELRVSLLAGADGDDDADVAPAASRVHPAMAVFTRPGAAVEVRGVERGLRGSWYAGAVLAASPDGASVRVRFFELLTDDGSRPLEEWVPLSGLEAPPPRRQPHRARKRRAPRRAASSDDGRSSDGGEDDDEDDAGGGEEDDDDGEASDSPRKRKRPAAKRAAAGGPRAPPRGFEQALRIRPAAPTIGVADFAAGTLVEAKLNDGWWQARVLRAEGPHRMLCAFPGEGDEARVLRRDTRAALVWRPGEGEAALPGTWFLAATGEPLSAALAAAAAAGGDGDSPAPAAAHDAAAAAAFAAAPDPNSDVCVICHRGGQLICCDGCPGAYHMACCGETRGSLPPGDYFCPECAALPPAVRAVPELAAAAAPLLRVPCLGCDAAGRPYWLAHGRLTRLEGGRSESEGRPAQAGPHRPRLRVFVGTSLASLASALRSSAHPRDARLAALLAACNALPAEGDADAAAVGTDACAPVLTPAAEEAAVDDGGPLGPDAAEDEAGGTPASLEAAGGAAYPGADASDEARDYVNRYRNAITASAAAQLANTAAKSRGRPRLLASRFTWPPAPFATADASAGSHLGEVVARVLHIERVLYPLLEGAWAKGDDWRRRWAERVVACATPAALAACVMQLEEALRPIALLGAGGGDGWRCVAEVARHAVLQDRPKNEKELREAPPLGPSALEALRRPAEAAPLPAASARRLARRGGRTAAPGAAYSARRGPFGPLPWARRSARDAWRAGIEAASTVAALALQVRLLDAQVQWSGLKRPGGKDSAAQAALAAAAAVAAGLDAPEPGSFRALRDAGPQPVVHHKRYIHVPASADAPGSAPVARVEYLVGPEDATSEHACAWVPDHAAPLWAARAYEESLRRAGAPPMGTRRALTLDELRPGLKGTWVELFWPDTGAWYAGEVLELSRQRGLTVLYETGETEEIDAAALLALVQEEGLAVRAESTAAAAHGQAQVWPRPVGRPRGTGRPAMEVDYDAIPEPHKCLSRDILEALALDWCGRDLSRQKLAKKRIVAMLPEGVLERAERAVLAGLGVPTRPEGYAFSERAPPMRVKERAGEGSDEEEFDEPEPMQQQPKVAKPPKEVKPPPEVVALSKGDRARANSVLVALRKATDRMGRNIAGPFIHVPTRKESSHFHKVIKFPIDLNSIAKCLNQKFAGYRTPWDFAYAVELLLTNSQVYHEEGSTVHTDAHRMRELFHAAHRAAFGAHVQMPPAMAYKLGISGAEPPDMPKPREPGAEPEEEDDGDAEMADAAAADLPVGEDLVGRRIRVYWPDDDAWYFARVRKFMRTTGQHMLRYEADGVEEWSTMSRERFELADAPAQAGGGAGRSGGDTREGLAAAGASGAGLVGRACAIYINATAAWQDGVIRKYNKSNRQHLVRYEDDGEEEWLDLASARVRWPSSGAAADAAQQAASFKAVGRAPSARAAGAADAGAAFIGRRCQVPWTDRKLYDAKVIDYDAGRGLHCVAYDADQIEWIDLARRRVTWVDERAAAAPAGWDTGRAMDILNYLRDMTAPGGRRIAELFELIPSKVALPYYHEFIKQPIAIATIEDKLKRGAYADADAFIADGELMFDNAFAFNPEGTEVHKDALKLRKSFRKRCTKAGFIATDEPAAGEEAAAEPPPMPAAPPMGFKIKLGGLKFKLGGGSVSGNLSALAAAGSEPASEPAPEAAPEPAREATPVPEAEPMQE
jgi:hypothetical protein